MWPGAVDGERRVGRGLLPPLRPDVHVVAVGVAEPESAVGRPARRIDLAHARPAHRFPDRLDLAARRAERQVVEALPAARRRARCTRARARRDGGAPRRPAPAGRRARTSGRTSPRPSGRAPRARSGAEIEQASWPPSGRAGSGLRDVAPSASDAAPAGRTDELRPGASSSAGSARPRCVLLRRRSSPASLPVGGSGEWTDHTSVAPPRLARPIRRAGAAASGGRSPRRSAPSPPGSPASAPWRRWSRG